MYFYVNYLQWRVGVPLTPSPNYHHVVGSYDGSAMHIYLDGVEAASTPLKTTINAGTAPLRIAKGYLLSWVGIIDEVALYNKGLSPDRILQHYQAGVHAP
jgi:hypothetical protein